MRLRLALALLLVSVFALVLTRHSRAEDRVTVRGNYYREPSTRVLAPVVNVEMDVPDERLTIEGQYLLDAVTSASIASGAAAVTGGDVLFTELRHETTLRLRSKLKDWNLGGSFRYSTESDYISRAFGLSVARSLLQNSIVISASYNATFNSVFTIRPSFRDTVPWISPSDPNGENGTNLLQVHYLSLGYSHALHRTLLAGLLLEGTYSHGPHENPYRRVNGSDFQAHPFTLLRAAPSVYLRWALPKINAIVLDLRYRFYGDDWKITSHSIDNRVHFRIAKFLVLRLRYQYYTQGAAFFALPAAEQPYPMDAVLKTADPKLQAMYSHIPGVQLTLRLDPLARFRGLRWMSGAWLQITYNHILSYPRSGDCSDYSFPYRTCRINEMGELESEHIGARQGSLAFSIPF